jgi:hypothetical protein
MAKDDEDWESERVFGHAIMRTPDERRCQVKAKVQCVLQKHMPKEQALLVAEEVVTELGL